MTRTFEIEIFELVSLPKGVVEIEVGIEFHKDLVTEHHGQSLYDYSHTVDDLISIAYFDEDGEEVKLYPHHQDFLYSWCKPIIEGMDLSE